MNSLHTCTNHECVLTQDTTLTLKFVPLCVHETVYATIIRLYCEAGISGRNSGSFRIHVSAHAEYPALFIHKDQLSHLSGAVNDPRPCLHICVTSRHTEVLAGTGHVAVDQLPTFEFALCSTQTPDCTAVQPECSGTFAWNRVVSTDEEWMHR